MLDAVFSGEPTTTIPMWAMIAFVAYVIYGTFWKIPAEERARQAALDREEMELEEARRRYSLEHLDESRPNLSE